jgi:hypothetical protein
MDDDEEYNRQRADSMEDDINNEIAVVEEESYNYLLAFLQLPTTIAAQAAGTNQINLPAYFTDSLLNHRVPTNTHRALYERNFSGLNLSYIKFSGWGFYASDFMNTNLTNTIFDNCYFDNVDFRGARIVRTRFLNGEMVDPDFSGAIIDTPIFPNMSTQLIGGVWANASGTINTRDNLNNVLITQAQIDTIHQEAPNLVFNDQQTIIPDLPPIDVPPPPGDAPGGPPVVPGVLAGPPGAPAYLAGLPGALGGPAVGPAGGPALLGAVGPTIPGVAFAIHNEFKKYAPSLPAYYAILTEAGITSPDATYANIKEYMRTKLQGFIDLLDYDDLKAKNTTELTTLLARLRADDGQATNAPTRVLIGKTLDFVNLQTPEFKKEYVADYVQSCTVAYAGQGNTASCIAGVYERVFVILIDILKRDCARGCSELNKRVLRLFEKEPLTRPKFGELFGAWLDIRNAEEQANPTLKNVESRKASLFAYIRSQPVVDPGDDELNQLLASESGYYTGIISNVEGDMEGGRRKKRRTFRKRNKRRKTRKVKKYITPRKSKSKRNKTRSK